MSRFSKIKYDVLDVELKDFDVDLGKFHVTIDDLDRRIGTIICQGFDDCSSLYSCFRLLDSFSGLLSRPIIQNDFGKKYFDLLDYIDRDLDNVFLIFQDHKDAPPIHSNMAPVTGALAWTHELKDRIQIYNEKLIGVRLAVLNMFINVFSS